MTWERRRRLLEGLLLVLGGLAGLVLFWWGYFILQKATFSQALVGTLFCLTCILVGLVGFTLKDHGTRWFSIDAKRLGRTQSYVLATGGLILAVCSLWLAIQKDIPVLGDVTGRLILYIGFFFFGYVAIVTFRRACQEK